MGGSPFWDPKMGSKKGQKRGSKTRVFGGPKPVVFGFPVSENGGSGNWKVRKLGKKRTPPIGVVIFPGIP